MKLERLNNLEDFGDLLFLDQHRFKNGQSFPKSYREFVKEYGYGLLCGLYLVYIPMGNHPDSWEVQNLELKYTMVEIIENEWYLTLEPDGNLDLIKNAIPFGKSENGDILFWDGLSYHNDEFDIFITNVKGSGVFYLGNNLFDVIGNMINPTKHLNERFFSNYPLQPTFKPIKRHE